ncbi:MAG TPA: CoA transferase, partial [Acidimicrobiales bacterium]|nr:CoA transferase [Acidimicrobiales bacterium]
AEQFSSTQERISRPGDVDALLSRWTAEQGKDDLEALLQHEGVPATAMRTPAEMLRSPQLRFRGAIRPVETEPGTVVGTVRPLHAGAFRRPSGDRPPRRRSIAGLKIYELSHVLAVPLAGALLGAMGAAVTKLEDPARLDMYRRRGPYIDDVPSPERTAYFAMVNHSKSSALVDLNRPEQVAAALHDADVVLENLGTRTSQRFEVDADSLAGARPDCLSLSSSGFGHRGPMAEYRAYAYNLQSTYGLTYLTRSTDGRPARMDHAWADLISGYAMATVVAAWAVGPGGNPGTAFDFAMGELIASRFNEFLAAASADPDSDQKVDRANETFPAAPNGVYPTAEGWLAVSVGTDEEFDRLRQALGDPPALSSAGFSTADGRWTDRDALDRAVAMSLPRRAAMDLAGDLRQAGVRAEAACTPVDLIGDPHLAERGFFVTVDHPEYGSKRLAGLPWRRAGGEAWPLRPPPLLGGGSPA